MFISFLHYPHKTTLYKSFLVPQQTPLHADYLKVMASVSDVAGAVGAVRFAAKVRCALVPPKPNEERPSWATGIPQES